MNSDYSAACKIVHKKNTTFRHELKIQQFSKRTSSRETQMFSRFFSRSSSSKKDADDLSSNYASDDEVEAGDEDEDDDYNYDEQSYDAADADQRSAAANSLDELSLSQHEHEAKSAQDNPLLPEELCEIPTFLNTACCDKRLVEATRVSLKKKFAKRPESFLREDLDRMLEDDWTVSRFLLRCRQDPKRAAKLMEQCGKFRREYKMGRSKLADFPIEFHRAGGLFRYAPDRVGNQTLYMRIKMHRRVSELSQIMKEFILCVLEDCDRANNGRGTAVIFDLTASGLQNVDPGFLFWLVYSFRNYCPKGLSYIIIYNLPWILNATMKLALSWLSSTNRKRLRFVSGEAIKDFIAPENLPDFMGGTCKQSYRSVPDGARLAEDTAEQHNMTREQSRKIREIYAKFLKEVDSDIEIDPDDEDNDKLKSSKDQQAAGLISSTIVAS